jgi:hypothetical protein
LFANIRENISLVFYCEIKRKWGKEGTVIVKQVEKWDSMGERRYLKTERD